jgi:hypothetical protein
LVSILQRSFLYIHITQYYYFCLHTYTVDVLQIYYRTIVMSRLPSCTVYMMSILHRCTVYIVKLYCLYCTVVWSSWYSCTVFIVQLYCLHCKVVLSSLYSCTIYISQLYCRYCTIILSILQDIRCRQEIPGL